MDYSSLGYDSLLTFTGGGVSVSEFLQPLSEQAGSSSTNMLFNPTTDTIDAEGIEAGDLVNPINIARDTFIFGGVTGYKDGEGFWLGYRKAEYDYAFFVGNSSGEYMSYDPDDGLVIIGSITASSGAIGGFSIGADYIRDAANSFGLASTVSGGDDVRFWAGDTFANRATAPFSITEAGVLTASSGTIAGWTLSSTEFSSGSVKIQSSAERILMGSATAPLTGTGIFIGKDTADYEIRAGDPSSSYIHWDGTDLTIGKPIFFTDLTGERVYIDATTFQALTTSNDVVFEVVLNGANAGDVILGNASSGGYVQWDESESKLIVAGIVQADVVRVRGIEVTDNILWSGASYTKVTNEESSIVLLESGSQMLTAGGFAATAWRYYSTPRPGTPFARTQDATRSGLTITPGVSTRVLDGVTEYVIAFALGGTACYRYDNDGQNETSVSFSGTAISTGARRIGYDPVTGYIYIMDGATKASTTVRVYTFSGTTLTYVTDITLSSAPATTGSTLMWLSESFLVIDDSSSTSNVTLTWYGKTGTLVSTKSWDRATTEQRAECIVIHPITNYMYILIDRSTDSGINMDFLSWNIDQPLP